MAPTYDYYTLSIQDLSGQLVSGKSSDRVAEGFEVSELIAHETSGPQDVRNASPAQAHQLDQNTINWFLTQASDVSIHYLVGGETIGAPVYRLCPENRAAYHAVGNKGVVDGVSKDNWISIGIERMGQPNDGPGPNQTAAMCKLALDIIRRHPKITVDHIISHQSIQSDRRDGNALVLAMREYVNANLGGDHVTDNSNQGPKPAAGDFSGATISFQDPVTGFYVLGDFARYYQAHGGLEFFGRPISSMTGGDTRFPDAQYIQWFERARFEWHPKEGLIMLGLVGREAMKAA